jgi:hypothetical protein
MFSTQDAMRPAPGKNNRIYKKENISGIENLTDVRLTPYSLTTLLILDSFYLSLIQNISSTLTTKDSVAGLFVESSRN